MTTKLRLSRYNLRRPDAPVQPRPMPVAAPAPAANPAAATAAQTAAPAQPPAAAPTPGTRAAARAELAPEMLFDNTDDGFGGMTFPTAAPAQPTGTDEVGPAIDAIRREGLTGRQLRLARRIAQKHQLPATSDFDAVRLLRLNGIDPFRRASILDMVTGDSDGTPDTPAAPAPASAAASAAPAGGDSTARGLATIPGDPVKLPQTIKPMKLPSTEVKADANHASDILKIQKDIARRRRRRLVLLATRMAFFVMLPTLIAAWYFYLVATPLFGTKSEFVIQQSEPAAAGIGGLFSGTQFATSQDSIAVQGYLQSRDAMARLDRDMGFRQHFQADNIDPIQRLDADATAEAAYKVYQRNVRIAYDPTEGIIKMEVVAADPAASAAWARQLIGYAEEQVDHLTQRLREDQMRGAREAYEESEGAVVEAQRRVVELQEKFKILSSEVEVQLLTTRIGTLEQQLTQDRLSLAQMESNPTPNKARMEPLIRRIGTLESEIAALRAKLTEDSTTGDSIAKVQGELLVAQADVQTRQMLLGQSLQAMETARAEANRQTRYLSLSVSPVPPDEATYPRAFENTLVTLLIFTGIYLMISMTVAILREQVSS